MLPTSHIRPMNVKHRNVSVLSAEFESFIAAANRLETTHQELHAEVARLRQELEERNCALEETLHKLHQSSKALTCILQLLPCGVILLEESGTRAAFANEEARELLGLQHVRGDRLPEPLIRVLSRADASPALYTDEMCIEAERSARWISLRTRWVQLPGDLARESRLVILQDVTAERELEVERECVRKSLSLAEISSVLAHEIRNPLGAIELFLTLLRTQGRLNGDAISWTNHVTAGVRSLSATVNNVLQFYATGSFTKSEIELWSIIRECVDFLQPVASEASLELRVQQCNEHVEVSCDSEAIRQVVLNLCGNAIRHSPDHSTVEVAMQVLGNKAVVEVSDQGQGIPPEHLPHIFAAGYSASGRRTGLGLAVCKRIIEAHGGKVSVAHTSHSGTTMRLEIPTL